MKNLLLKEWKLCTNTQLWIYFVVGIIVNLAPNYPHYFSAFFLCIGIHMIFQMGVVNKDILFTTCLPVQKKDAVKARCMLIGTLELLLELLSIPCIFISNMIGIENAAGIEMNVAFIGFSFILFTLYNLSFMGIYYKKADKASAAFLISSFLVLLPAIGILESLTFFKGMDSMFGLFCSFIDSSHPEDLVAQIPVLAVGLIIWILGLILSYFIASRKFEKVDL